MFFRVINTFKLNLEYITLSHFKLNLLPVHNFDSFWVCIEPILLTSVFNPFHAMQKYIIVCLFPESAISG